MVFGIHTSLLAKEREMSNIEGHSDRDRISAITLLWDEIIKSFKRQNSSTSDFRVGGTNYN